MAGSATSSGTPVMTVFAALQRAEKYIVYKDNEEAELRKLRAQWKKKQVATGESGS